MAANNLWERKLQLAQAAAGFSDADMQDPILRKHAEKIASLYGDYEFGATPLSGEAADPTTADTDDNTAADITADWLLEASKGFMGANKMFTDLARLGGEYTGIDSLREAGQAGSEFFERGIESATWLQSKPFQEALGGEDINATKIGATILGVIPQIPMFVGGAGGIAAGAGKATQLGARLAGRGAEQAAALGTKVAASRPATIASFGGFGGAAGAADTYSEAYGEAIDIIEKSRDSTGLTEAEKERVAREIAREASLKQLPVAAITNAIGLGGAAVMGKEALKKMVEKQAATPLLKAIAKGAALDAGTEAAEEGAQGYNVNVSLREIDPSRDPFQGVRMRATLGAIAGGVLGGGVAGLENAGARRQKAQQDISDQLWNDLQVDAGKGLEEIRQSAPLGLPAPAAAAQGLAAPVTPAASGPAALPGPQPGPDLGSAEAPAAGPTPRNFTPPPVTNRSRAAKDAWDEFQSLNDMTLDAEDHLDSNFPGWRNKDVVRQALNIDAMPDDQLAAAAAAGNRGAQGVLMVRRWAERQAARISAFQAAQRLDQRDFGADQQDVEATRQRRQRDDLRNPRGYERGVDFPMSGEVETLSDRIPLVTERADQRPGLPAPAQLGAPRLTTDGTIYVPPEGPEQRGRPDNRLKPEERQEGIVRTGGKPTGRSFQQMLKRARLYAKLGYDPDRLLPRGGSLAAPITQQEQDAEEDGDDRASYLSEAELKASDIYVGLFNKLTDELGDAQPTAHQRQILGQLAEKIESPGRYHEVDEAENPLGIKIGDTVIVDKAPNEYEATVISVNAARGTTYGGFSILVHDGEFNFGGWTGINNVKKKEEKTAAPEAAKKKFSEQDLEAGMGAFGGAKPKLTDKEQELKAKTAGEPTEAQKEAGNYKKEHVRMHGLDIAIENPRGSVRRGKDENGREWENTLAHDYGYIKRTEGNDGDQVDVFVGNNLTSDKVFVVNQTHKDGKFDEHKVMLGFSSAAAAEAGYLANYDKGWDRYESIVPMSVEQFKAWLKDGDQKKPAAEPEAAAPTMQPRDRDRAASIEQMSGINKTPYYGRLGPSRSPESGAPMVFVKGDAEGVVPEEQLGKTEIVTMGDDTQIMVRYAVVEAQHILASHGASGKENKGYASPKKGEIVALNNGRVAGLQASWKNENATRPFEDKNGNEVESYYDQMVVDYKGHGIDADVIGAMNEPVLVRLYLDADNYPGIGDASNVRQSLAMSASEQAVADARLIGNFNDLIPSDDGDVLAPSNSRFIQRFLKAVPAAERGNLVDDSGAPNKAARDRIENAIIWKAYQNEDILKLQAESADPDIKTILNAMMAAAPSFARLTDNDLDLGGWIASGADLFRQFKRSGTKSFDEYLATGDMFGRDPEAEVMAKFMADNLRSQRRMAEAFRALADYANMKEGEAATGDMLGGRTRATRSEAMLYANQKMKEKYGDDAKQITQGSLLSGFRTRGEAQSEAGKKDEAGSPASGGDTEGEPAKGGRAETKSLTGEDVEWMLGGKDVVSFSFGYNGDKWIGSFSKTESGRYTFHYVLNKGSFSEYKVKDNQGVNIDSGDSAADLALEIDKSVAGGVKTAVGIFRGENETGWLLERGRDLHGEHLARLVAKEASDKGDVAPNIDPSQTKAGGKVFDGKFPSDEMRAGYATKDNLLAAMKRAGLDPSLHILKKEGNRNWHAYPLREHRGDSTVRSYIEEYDGRQYLTLEEQDQHLPGVETLKEHAKRFGGKPLKHAKDMGGKDAGPGWVFDGENGAKEFQKILTGGWSYETGTGGVIVSEDLDKKKAAKPKAKGYGESNKKFTKDDLDDAMKKFTGGTPFANPFNPELMTAALNVVGYHVEAGFRSFADMVRAVADRLGGNFDKIRPYLKGAYNQVRDLEDFDNSGMDPYEDVRNANIDDLLVEGGEDAVDSSVSVEPGGAGAAAGERVGQDVLQPEPAGAGDGDADQQGQPVGVVPVADGDRNAGAGAAAAGKQSTGGVRGGSPGARADVSGGAVGQRGAADSSAGVEAGRVTDEAVKASASGLVTGRTELKKLYEVADKIETKKGDIGNIRKTLPNLLEGQQDDVKFAEDRFARPDGQGVMFTNGTGTGKTFTGLGIVKRFARDGKSRILIAGPSAVKADWIKAGASMGLKISELNDTNDKGSGIVITTIEGMGMNNKIGEDEWDLVVIDEAQKLAQNKQGVLTDAGEALRALAYHPDGVLKLAEMRYPNENEEFKNAIAAREILMRKRDVSAMEARTANDRVDAAERAWMSRRREVAAAVAAKPKTDRTKVVFLSATPFAYRETVNYADGLLFDMGSKEKKNYATPSPYEQFFISHFGYRYRYGKLAQPDESKVDVSLLETEFNSWLKRNNALSGRTLDVPFDYDRRFILVDDAVGNKIDEGLTYIQEDGRSRFFPLYEELEQVFKHQQKLFLLEAIKAKYAVAMAKKLMADGRKVVVFHDFNKGGGFHPFRFKMSSANDERTWEAGGKTYSAKWNDIVADFNKSRPDLVNLNLDDLKSPIETFKEAFGDQVLLYNGMVSDKDSEKAKTQFIIDGSGKDLILVQSDKGSAGLSLHDTSGKHLRVSINLGLPLRPVKALQSEGRIYRTGQASDSLQTYLTTGTSFETRIFTETIASRADTAENLGQGAEARDIKNAFVDGYADALSFDETPLDGKGGKERDRRGRAAVDQFTQAKTHYWANLKKSGGRGDREGIDYFPTPEPLGMKMVQWAGARPGDKALEPSVGHGAIARYFSDSTDNTIVDSSVELIARASLVAKNARRTVAGMFEDYDLVNKHDVIVMNPPFGHGGSTAMGHLEKATRHLRKGGRVVALIPTGPAADKRFDKWFYDNKDTKHLSMVATVSLPRVTFERAGTSVSSRIVIIDSAPASGPAQNIDLSTVDDINSLFDRIENLSIQPRQFIEYPEEEAVKDKKPAKELKLEKKTSAGAYVAAFAKDSKRVKREDWARFSSEARLYNGTWVRDLGFVFKDEKSRDNFISAIDEIQAGDTRFKRDGGGPDQVLRAAVGVGGSTTQAVQAVVDRISAAWRGGPKIRVVQSESQLPEAIREIIAREGADGEIHGVFHDGAVYLVADNIPNDADAEVTLLHEAVGHFGMRKLLGDGYVKFLDQVLLSYSGSPVLKKILKDYGYDLKNRGDALKAADELVAHMAESGDRPGLLRQLVAMLRQWLRDIGFDAALTRMSDNDILSMLARAERNMRNPQASFSSAMRRQAVAGPRFNRDGGERVRMLVGRAVQLWREVAKRKRTAIYAMPASKDLAEIVAEIEPNEPVKVETLNQQSPLVRAMVADGEKVSEIYRVTMPKGAKAAVIVDRQKGVVYINAALLDSGGGGSMLYQAVATFALNNGLKFVGDPAGVSFIAQIRRTEHMISHALKAGTTSHLLPAQETLSRKNSKAFPGRPPMGWKEGDDEYNLSAMLAESYTNVGQFLPEIGSIVYDTAKWQFIWSPGRGGKAAAAAVGDGRAKLVGAGEVVDPGEKRTHADAGRGGVARKDLEWLDSLAPGQVLDRGDMARLGDIASRRFTRRLVHEGVDRSQIEHPFGGSTIARAAITNTALRSGSAESWADVLDTVASQLDASVGDDPFTNIRYRRIPGEPSTNGGDTVRFRRIRDIDYSPLLPGNFELDRETIYDTFVRKVQDKLLRLKRVQEKIVKDFGQLPDELNAYRAEELMHGRVETMLTAFEKSHVEPLVEAMARAGVDQETMDMYLYAAHAKERNKHIREINSDNAEMQDGGSGMTDEQADAILDAFATNGQSAALKDLAGMVYTMNDARLKIIEDYGLESKETLAKWRKYKNYVPLKGKRGGDIEGEFVRKLGQGLSVKGKESLRALGRKSMAESPLMHSIAQIEEVILRAERNRVGQSFYKMVERYKDSDLWEILTPHTDYVRHYDSKTREVIEVPNFGLRNQDDIFTLKIDGVEKYIRVRDPLLMRALKNMGPEPLNALTRVMGWVNRKLAAFNTSLNPEFVISNAFRDLQTALFNLEVESSKKDGLIHGQRLVAKTIKDIAPAMRGIWKALRKSDSWESNEWASAYEEFRALGGQIGFFGLKDYESRAADIERMLAEANGDWAAVGKKGFRNLRDFIYDGNAAVENAVRLSAFVNARDTLIADATAKYGSIGAIPKEEMVGIKERAASLAKNITVNFNRKGELGSMLNAMYLFANASIQGTAQFGKVIFTKKGAWIAGSLTVSAWLLAELNRAMAGDDDDDRNFYDKVPDWVKERNLVLMKWWKDDGSYITVPLPYGYNVFHVFGASLSDAAHGKDLSKVSLHVAGSVLGAFSPLGSEGSDNAAVFAAKFAAPTILDPAVQLATNENFFGEPIYNEGYRYSVPRPDSALYWKSTGEVSRWLADSLNAGTGGTQWRSGAIDISPDTIEHMFDFTFGGAGAFYRRTGVFAEQLLGEDPVDPNVVPFARRVSGQISDRSDQAQYYDRRDRIKQYEEEWKGVRQGGDAAEISAWREKNAAYLSMFEATKAAENGIRKLRDQRRRVEAAKVPEDMKRKRLKEIDAKIGEAIDRYNKAYNSKVGED